MSALLQTATLPVCPDEKDGVTFCVHCGINPAKRKFCSDACRQAAYRQSPAHQACLKRDRQWRAARRLAHFKEVNRNRAIGAFPVFSGPINESLPPLGTFWISASGKRMNLKKGETA